METLRGGSRHAGAPPASVRYITPGSAEYPERLTHLTVPPEELWARGPLRIPSDGMIGIVGTRRATEYGRRMAHDLALDLAAEGWVIVSGLAGGIDAAAHRGALAAAGATIGVLGCGVDRVYPFRNRSLYASIAERGLLLSEFAPGVDPRKFHFPMRNRIIAALSSALVVVQAGEKSGALITVGMALDLGRPVLAVPGPADQEVSRGVHQMLREGAGVAVTAGDVLRELGESGCLGPDGMQGTLFATRAHPPDPDTAGPASRLRKGLAAGPALVDDLARATGLTVPAALAMLCRMELGGMVRSLPGHRFELVRRP